MLGYFCRVRLVILPQAFQRAMPATINQFVITFKETSLVVIIGIFDFMASANAAYQTGVWTPYYKEVYLFRRRLFSVALRSLSRTSRLNARSVT
jgi:general L-amino acid transport system permease protein